MVIVQVIGGTGSQMAAFSRGYALAKDLNTELVLDIADYHNGYKFPYALDYFNINCRKLTYVHASNIPISKDVVPQSFVKDFKPYFIMTNDLTYKEIRKEAKLAASECIYLVGEGVGADEYNEELKELFKPRKPSAFLAKFNKEISGIVSVGVHIRQTDFVSLDLDCKLDYYLSAINFMLEIYPNAVFYIFSDDIEGMKKKLGNKEYYRFVDTFGGVDSDIEEILAIAACDHRILSSISNFSTFSTNLSKSKNAINIRYVAPGQEKTLAENYREFTEKDIREYAGQHLLRPEVNRVLQISKLKTDINSFLNACEWDSAEELISAVRADSFCLNEDDKSNMMSFRELISSEKGDFVSVEQCLSEHLQNETEAIDTNYNMAIVKYSLNKKKQALLYASNACRLSSDEALIRELKEIFNEEKSDDVFEFLVNCPKMHFIIFPLLGISYYRKYSDSLAILLKRLGHQVSLIGELCNQEIPGKYSLQQLADLSLENRYDICQCYNFNIPVYPYLNSENGDISTELVNKIKEMYKLPTAIICRSVHAAQQLPNENLIYWDFSCPLDTETIVLRNGSDINVIDSFFNRFVTKVITTDKERYDFFLINREKQNVKLSKPYIKSQEEYHFIEGIESFTPNHIESDELIEFAVDLLKLSLA